MKKIFTYMLAVLIAVMTVVVPMTNDATVWAALDIDNLEDGIHPINHRNQFLNPYDNLTGVNGSPASDTAINAGNNVMNMVMGPSVSFEKVGNDIYVILLLAIDLEETTGTSVQNLDISVEDSVGSNTYTSVDFTVGDTTTIDDQEFIEHRFKVDSLHLVIRLSYTMMMPTGFFIMLGDESEAPVTPVVNKSALQAKLTEARAIINEGVTADSFTRLQEAIAVAQLVYDDPEATQDAVNEQVTLLTNAISTLVTVSEGLQDGIYEVPVALWHATENRPSMVAASLNETARLHVKDGVETMYVYTQAGTMGYIPGFQILTQAQTYVNAEVMTRNAEGTPTSFSFLLENHNEYLNIKVLTSNDPNSGLDARFKFDFTQLKQIDGDTDLGEAPVSTPTTNPNPIGPQDENNDVVKTADGNAMSHIILLAISSLFMMLVLTSKKGFISNGKNI